MLEYTPFTPPGDGVASRVSNCLCCQEPNWVFFGHPWNSSPPIGVGTTIAMNSGSSIPSALGKLSLGHLNLTPFRLSEADEQLFLENLRRFLGLVKEEGVVCASLSEAATLPSSRSAELSSMYASPSVLNTYGAGSA
jgi:hypothetical protein